MTLRLFVKSNRRCFTKNSRRRQESSPPTVHDVAGLIFLALPGSDIIIHGTAD